MLLEKTLESPLDFKEIKLVNSKGNQFWIFIGGTDAEAPILWPPDVKSWLIRKDPVDGKDRRQEEKGMTEDERIRLLDSITDSMDVSLSKLWEMMKDGKPGVLQSTGSQRAGHEWVTEQQQQTPS